MSTFDQRGQKVNYQYNVAGNINFGSATTSAAVAVELNKLLQEVNKATIAGAIDPENGIDVEAKIKKAAILSEKPQPDKDTILEQINGAKAIIESLASAAGLVGGFMQAIEMIKRVLMAKFDQRRQKVNTQVNAEIVHLHLSNLVHQVWDELEPDLQDAFSMAYNQARRDGVNVIKTRYLIAALVKLNTESVSEFLKHVPGPALPKPISKNITTERTILDGNPTLSGCVEDSLKHLSPKASSERKLSSADVLVDIAKYGTGNSVARLRNNGITEERVTEIVDELGLDLINR